MERNMVGVSRRTRPNSADNQQVFSDPRTHESRCILHLEHSANIFLVAQQKNLCYVAEIAAIFDVEKSEDSCSKCLKVMNSGRDFFFPSLRVDLEVLTWRYTQPNRQDKSNQGSIPSTHHPDHHDSIPAHGHFTEKYF